MKMCVYLIRAGAFHKIGTASNFVSRLGQIQSSNANPVYAVALMVGAGGDVEAQWHSRFAKKRVRGEWFELSPEDVAEFVSRADFLFPRGISGEGHDCSKYIKRELKSKGAEKWSVC